MTFPALSRFINSVRCAVLTWSFILLLLIPAPGLAVDAAPALSDREIIERLTRLEEGQHALREGQESLRAGQNALKAELNQLRQDMNTQLDQLRQDMNAQLQQLRQDMNAQFAQVHAQFTWVFQLMIGMLGAFAAIVAVTISLAVWDRRTMIRSFEDKMKAVEQEISNNRQRLHALLEALRALSQKDHQVAEILKRFDLL